MSVEKGDLVRVEYEGTLDDGTVFDSSKHGDHSHPLEFVVGSGQVIAGFDEAVLGMEQEQEKTFTIDPANAYGEHDSSLIRDIPRSAFGGQEVQPGMTLAAQTPQGGQLLATVVEVKEEVIVIDLNHPLAGKHLTFKIKVIGIEKKQ